jgi:serine protease AprX
MPRERFYTRPIATEGDRPTRGHAPGRPARARRIAAIALALCVGVAAPAAAQQPSAGTPAKAPKADRDGDRVFDDLEQRLAPRARDERVDVIVTLESSASAARVKDLERRVGQLTVRSRFSVVDGFAARASKAQVAELARRPGVVAVESDGRVRALNQSGSLAFGVTRARLDNSSLDGNRDGSPATYSGRDMVAAVLDTGIDSRHRDLDEGKVIAFANCVGGRCARRTAFDDQGHGTHVSATLAGEGDALPDRRNRGVAPAAALVGVKVLGADGTSTDRSIIAGIEWAVANRTRYGIEAINMSIGGGGCSSGTDAMSTASNRAAAAGLVVVAAAGNSGPARCTIGAPAAASGALAVGSMADPAHGGFLTSWMSSRGRYGHRIKPDVMGPGIGVVSARYGSRTAYVPKTGTSMASPFVAGVALLMRDANPGISAATIRSRLRSTAFDWGPAGPDIDFGWGRLNAYAALRSAGASRLVSPPRPPDHRLFAGRFAAQREVRNFPLKVRNRCTPIAAGLVTVPWNGYNVSGDFDFDVRLFDPAGNEVEKGTGLSDERQDDVSHLPQRLGTYRLEISSYKGTGNFFADVSAGLSPRAAPARCSAP